MSDAPKPLPDAIREASPVTKILYLYLRRHNHKRYPLRKLADALGLSTTAVRESLDELETAGMLERERNGTNPSVLHVA